MTWTASASRPTRSGPSATRRPRTSLRISAGKFGYGDVWTFTGICADTKLIASWRVGPRDIGTATEFMQDLAGRLSNRIQLTTDGHRMYLEAVEDAFAHEIDYAMFAEDLRPGPGAAASLQPRKVPGNSEATSAGRPRRGARQHVLRGAPQPIDADAHSALHAAH